ncbi:unnamed protein product [Eruca vesicaria subsp. sativa]|uniref:RING-type E3 ubiquitin transferase n=1 Tax=Eruca vesicaria subsp. sativa TaxID=29727 RepID=A0ABC8KDT2_ERUVS|nr:unnamed protein product [Eruca vesicaria subsp. sativa]
MGQRNRTVDLEMEQQHQSQASLQPGPCILLGSFPQQQQPDNSTNLPAVAASFPNLEAPTSYDSSAMFYGLPQYHHPHQLHQPAPPPTNYYVPYPAFQGPPSQLPSSSTHGVSSDHDYDRNAHFMDHTRGAYKRKNADGLHMNPQYLSTLAAPFNNTPETIAPFGAPRSRPGAVSMNPALPPPHAPNSFFQGSYPGHHPLPPPGSIWYDQHHGRSDGSPSFWPHPPYMHGSNIVAGSIESSSRNPTAFMYPPQLSPRDHYFHPPPPPPPVQGVRGQSATLYPTMASYGFPHGNFASQNTINRGPSGSEMGPVQPTGFRIYQHHQRDDSVPLAALRQHRGGVPRFRMMPDDEVAILEFGDFLGGSGNNHIDHHRDMRLDIEEMSYEELLALSERIGTVNTGLPEEDVKNHLKTRTCSVINHAEESSSSSPQTKDRGTEPCTICQESFKNEEKIATLDCGHEYHAECLEKWLVVKNVCPICKAEALVMEKTTV